MKQIKQFYCQTMPHIQPIGATFFVTFRLYDSFPQSLIQKTRKEFDAKIRMASRKGASSEELSQLHENYIYAFDKVLDKIKSGPHYLKDPKIAKIIKDKLFEYDGEFYDLLAFCIMSNHVHLLIDTSIQLKLGNVTSNYMQLYQILKRIKGGSAIASNTLLKRSGKYWAKESFDHYVRNDKSLSRIVAYILNNPFNAGLVKDWEEWPHTYLKGWS